MTLAIILTAIICGTVILLALMWGGSGRDSAARDRDRGLAKLYEARANLVLVEELERRAVLRRQDDDDRVIREARGRRRRDAACEEARQS